MIFILAQLYFLLVGIICFASEPTFGIIINKVIVRPSSSSLLMATRDSQERRPSYKAKDEKEWKSGYVFNGGGNGNNNRDRQPQQQRRRNDPWWMREEEKNNPRVLPEYKTWWASGDAKLVDSHWKVADLRVEAARRGIEGKALKKDELISVLNSSLRKYTLGEAGFRPPFFVKLENEDGMPPCYPDVYEDPEQIEILRHQAFATKPPSEA